MKHSLIGCTVLAILLIGNPAWAQQSASGGDSHKYRTVFTVAGGGGGFALGIVGGLAAFDDATNSDRKVWTTATLSAIGGAVSGYFLGRAIDKHSKKTKVSWASDEHTRNFLIFQGVSQSCKTPVSSARETPSLAESVRLLQSDWSCWSSAHNGFQ